MNQMPRKFEVKDAIRSHVPLLVGIMGCAGAGKSFSSLRLATGIQKVTGGDIYGIDTEARRMLHYADGFKFKHLQFDPPHGSMDYLAAIEHCVKAGAGVIIVDSMSHEHSGIGGMLEAHEQELDRLAGDDWGKRERVKMLAWQKPKAARRRLIDRLLQINANFIFCFRAKETVKPMKVNGKTEIVPQGFMPIAGDEFLYEQTVNILLLPKANGIPTWRSDNVGERLMMKCPKQFETIFADQKPLDEEIGRHLAEWARGGQPAPQGQRPAADAPAAIPEAPLRPSAAGAAPADDRLKQMDDALHEAAKKGTAALRDEWATLHQTDQKRLKAALDRVHKPLAVEMDQVAEADADAHRNDEMKDSSQ